MTRRIDWRDGATVQEVGDVKHCERLMTQHRERLAKLSMKRKRLIARCYAKAARAAKRGK